VGEKMSINKQIKNTVRDLVFDFMIEHRTHDRDLPLEAIDKAIFNGEITLDEIADSFKENMCYMLGVENEAELKERIDNELP
jgi:hypothetical protein